MFDLSAVNPHDLRAGDALALPQRMDQAGRIGSHSAYMPQDIRGWDVYGTVDFDGTLTAISI